MRLNRAERLVVNNPLRVLQQWVEIQWFKKRLTLGEDATVLEVGCGRGAGARVLLRQFKPARVHALDLDVQMLQEARDLLSVRDRERITLCAGNVSRLPFGTGCLDAVFCFGVLHHATDWRGALAEISRVLKTGGLFVLEELYPSLYQNALTGRFLAHPREDRFQSGDLRKALREVNMPLRAAREFEKLGILGIASKVD